MSLRWQQVAKYSGPSADAEHRALHKPPHLVSAAR